MLKASEMKGKAALVTGVIGMLGRATARKLARAGADVVLVDFDGPELDAIAGELRDLGVRAHVHGTDLTVAENCRAAVETAISTFGRLDALCNVANAFLPSRTSNVSKGDWDLSLALNLSAPFYLIQASIPHLLKSDGAVVNVTSCVSVLATPYNAAYTASKAGLTQMTMSLAMEYIHDPIRFNLVSPGAMATNTGTMASIPDDLDPSLFKRSSSSRGMVGVEDVADLISFLASDASRSYHGTCITIDKGVSLGLPANAPNGSLRAAQET
jgi:NAD(P)-dependent dehydrogenase (short-subunit alcohol dehydrogenase family)